MIIMEKIEKAIEANPFDHIIYECLMYLQASILISTDQFINNLLVDSRMVHLRNLACFFSSESDIKKSYLHYSMFLSVQLTNEVSHDLMMEIQRITSNSTCHLLKGRFSESFKQESARFEQSVFPKLLSLVKQFLSAAFNDYIQKEYRGYWMDERIQENADYAMRLVVHIEEKLSFKSKMLPVE